MSKHGQTRPKHGQNMSKHGQDMSKHGQHSGVEWSPLKRKSPRPCGQRSPMATQGRRETIALFHPFTAKVLSISPRLLVSMLLSFLADFLARHHFLFLVRSIYALRSSQQNATLARRHRQVHEQDVLSSVMFTKTVN